MAVEKFDVEEKVFTYTDREFAKILKMDLQLFKLRVRTGPPKTNRASVQSDIRLVPCIHIGRQRRWDAESVHNFVKGLI